MNQIVLPFTVSCFVLITTAFSAPALPPDPSITKAAVRECSRSFYQLGRDLTQVPQVELHDPKNFFSLIKERIDDQRAVISIVRAQAREDSTIEALRAADKVLDEARKSLREVETKDNYGEIAFSAGRSISESTPFRDFFLKTLGKSIPTVGESITPSGN